MSRTKLLLTTRESVFMLAVDTISENDESKYNDNQLEDPD